MRKWNVPLGSVATELWANALVYLMLGGLLLISGIAAEPGGAAAAGAGGAVLFGGIMLGRWRPLLLKSVAHAEVAEALSDAEIESGRQTAFRAVGRLAIVAAPLAYVVWAKVPPSGEALMGGIWAITGVFFLSAAGGLRIWERKHGQSLVRETKRWAWIDGSDHVVVGWATWWERVKTMRRRGRQSGWHWFAANAPQR